MKKTFIYKNLFKNSIFSNNLKFGDEKDLLKDKPIYFTGFCDYKNNSNNFNYKIIKVYKSKFLINQQFCLYKNISN